jgi:hypothetical protein
MLGRLPTKKRRQMADRLEEVLGTLRSLVAFDLKSIFDEHHSLLPVQLWPQEACLAVKDLTSRELFAGTGKDRVLIGVRHTVRLSDRVRALELALREAGLLHPDRMPVTDLDQLTDRELIERVEYHVINNPSNEPGHYWGVMSDEQIDADFARLVTAYRALRPNVVIDARNPSADDAQRLLPAPTHSDTLERDEHQAALPEPVAAVLPDEPPIPFKQPVVSLRDRRGAIDQFALAGHLYGSRR